MAWSPRRACLVASFGCLAVTAAVGPAVAQTTRPAPAPAAVPAARPATLPATRPVVARPAKPAVEPLPTQGELQAMYDEGKYADVLKHLRNVLILKGPAAQPYNKYDLLLLRAETHLRMKAQAPAVASYAEAAEATDDAQKVAYTKAVTLLLKRSKNLHYQPSPQKKERPAPIDVVDPESRKTALKALLSDEMAVVIPKVEAALDGKTLGGIAEGLAAVQGLEELEVGAGGGEDAKQMVVDLRTRGLALMAKTLQIMIARTDDIARSANEVLRLPVTFTDVSGREQTRFEFRKRGLERNDYRDLKEIVKTSDLIIPNAKGLAKATGGKQREIEDLVTAAEELKRKADKTLNADYSRI